MLRPEHIDVVILCGGRGERLRARIGETQKTMAGVGAEPFLNILLKYLRQQGFRRVILGTGYQAAQVEDYYRRNPLGLEISFCREENPLGTGGAVKKAGRLTASDPFLALNGDCFCRLDYEDLLRFYAEKNARAVLTVSEVTDASDFGSITLDAEARIVRFDEKADSPKGPLPAAKTFVNSGIYCFSRSVLDLMPPQEAFSIEKEFFPGLARSLKGQFYGYRTREPFLDIGTPQRYQQAQDMLK